MKESCCCLGFLLPRLQGKSLHMPTSSLPPYDNMTEESAFSNPIYEAGVSMDSLNFRDVDSQNTVVLSWAMFHDPVELSRCRLNRPARSHHPRLWAALSFHVKPPEGALHPHHQHSSTEAQLLFLNMTDPTETLPLSGLLVLLSIPKYLSTHAPSCIISMSCYLCLSVFKTFHPSDLKIVI